MYSTVLILRVGLSQRCLLFYRMKYFLIDLVWGWGGGIITAVSTFFVVFEIFQNKKLWVKKLLLGGPPFPIWKRKMNTISASPDSDLSGDTKG